MDQTEAAQPVTDESILRRIERLQLDYISSIDDGPLDNWPQFFTEKCLYTVVSRDNHSRGMELGVMRFESVGMLIDRATATQHAAVFAPRIIRHVLGPMIVDETGEGYRSRCNVVIYQTSPDGDTMLLMAAQYNDIIVELDGVLKFKEKRVVYDTHRIPDSIVYPL
ncbi:MAG: anthranilate 1,2-dioxygenase [Rhodospirillaceae bacterium]|nr:anthranilate 1,2-dioxygenase [Rhodospirillaceae bacterium]|tara:strand:- start:2497 stop:2994 length:498 start_codon:yes stop_codon:yes gene_type:complete